jgi:hypothetical protein
LSPSEGWRLTRQGVAQDVEKLLPVLVMRAMTAGRRCP